MKKIVQITILCSFVLLCNCRIVNDLFHKIQQISKTQGISSQKVTLGHGISIQNQTKDDKYFDEHEHPRYQYEYVVSDKGTFDQKNHWETRDGDEVKGKYSFVQPDGKIRTVYYTANGQEGFKAYVTTTNNGGNKTEGTNQKKQR